MQRGFSLVELSIVLVILGLLTGGILAGQSLIRAAELRAVSTEFDRYFTASQTFRDKYFGLPGDIRNASKIWGPADGGTGDTLACGTTTTSDARTCNGNGNGLIDLLETPYANSNEYFRYWQQLANAGLIEGTYSGIEASGGISHGVGGTNVPRSKLSNAIWYVRDMGTRSGHAELFDGGYGNSYLFGGAGTIGQPNAPALKAEEAWNIDTKGDDGMPATGKITPLNRMNCTVLANGSAMTADAAGAAAMNASYALASTGNQCILLFRRLF